MGFRLIFCFLILLDSSNLYHVVNFGKQQVESLDHHSPNHMVSLKIFYFSIKKFNKKRLFECSFSLAVLTNQEGINLTFAVKKSRKRKIIESFFFFKRLRWTAEFSYLRKKN